MKSICVLFIPVAIYAWVHMKNPSPAIPKSVTASEEAYSRKNRSTRDDSGEARVKAIFLTRQIQDSPPQVKILMPDGKGSFTWNTQVRYSIDVSDAKDGESKYGEINGSEVLLEIEYLPASKEAAVTEQIKNSQTSTEPKGLTLIKRSTCFGCHADKTRIAGPSFSEIAEKYGHSPAVMNTLGSHIVNGSSGVWGSLEMPAHPGFTEEEAVKIADYILQQGANKYRWVYPGLEGAFRIIGKPKNDTEGIYILTASYTSTSNVRGQHSVILKIK